MGKVILVSSGKGGTGKTMFSVNLGALLAEKGYKTILLDMDMGLRNMDLYLGMENKVVYNIMDVMSGDLPDKEGDDTGERFYKSVLYGGFPAKR